jgi:hypothetical protein
MRHPSLYSTVPFGALRVMQVDPGTVIKDERSGQEITVTDDTVAFKGPVCFCTKKVFDALKAAVPEGASA